MALGLLFRPKVRERLSCCGVGLLEIGGWNEIEFKLAYLILTTRRHL